MTITIDPSAFAEHIQHTKSQSGQGIEPGIAFGMARECEAPRANSESASTDVAQSGILTIDEVAGVLRCSVDRIRRIPLDELASYDGPGRCLLYLLEDVLNYIRQQKRIQRRGSGLGGPAPSSEETCRPNLATAALEELRSTLR